MASVNDSSRRCILGVFPHPDDETSSCAGTFIRYAKEGVEVFVATATRGELGALGADGVEISRKDLPAVREAELRTVLELYGANPPIMLGYHDQELEKADFEGFVKKIILAMEEAKPDVVITFGPSGISRHEDHIAIHKAAVEAFHRYREGCETEPRLFYVAIPKDIAEQFDLELDESETDLSVVVDISEFVGRKIQGLRLYRSQQDAQELADMFESQKIDREFFHQAHPPILNGKVSTGFWE